VLLVLLIRTKEVITLLWLFRRRYVIKDFAFALPLMPILAPIIITRNRLHVFLYKLQTMFAMSTNSAKFATFYSKVDEYKQMLPNRTK
jgi:hypothetical protein